MATRSAVVHSAHLLEHIAYFNAVEAGPVPPMLGIHAHGLNGVVGPHGDQELLHGLFWARDLQAGSLLDDASARRVHDIAARARLVLEEFERVVAALPPDPWYQPFLRRFKRWTGARRRPRASAVVRRA